MPKSKRKSLCGKKTGGCSLCNFKLTAEAVNGIPSPIISEVLKSIPFHPCRQHTETSVLVLTGVKILAVMFFLEQFFCA